LTINPRQFLNEVDNLSNSSLKRRDDLLSIFQITFENSLEDQLEQITFTAKFIWGLLSVLKSGKENPEIENLVNIKKDLAVNIGKVKEELNHIIEKDALLKFRFEAEYFAMNQASFQSLNELLHDLEWTKKYLNIQKRSKKN